MPLSPERIAELDAYYAKNSVAKPSAPVNLIMPKSENERNAAIADVFNAGNEVPTGMSPERLAELDAYYAKQQPSAEQPISSTEDAIRSAGGGLARGGAGFMMSLPNLLNEAAAGPQLLGRGIADAISPMLGAYPQPRGELWKPFIGSSEALQMLPEPLRPYEPKTTAGVAADFAGQMFGAVGAGKALAAAPKAKTTWEATSDASKASDIQKAITAPVSGKTAVELHDAITQGAEDILKESKNIFGVMREAGRKGPDISMKGAGADLKAIIDDIETTGALHPAWSKRGMLRDIAEKISKTGKLSSDEAIDLKRALNERFDIKDVGSLRSEPTARVSSILDNAFSNYAKVNPEFAAAKDAAYSYHANFVAPLKDASGAGSANTLKKLGWEFKDIYTKRQRDSGQSMAMGADTKNATKKILSNLKTDADYEAVASLIPADKLERFKFLTKNTAFERGGAAGSKWASPIKAGFFGLGAMGGSPVAKARFIGEVQNMVGKKDINSVDLLNQMKAGVRTIESRLGAVKPKHERLAEMVAKKVNQNQLLIEGPTTNGLPRSAQLQGYVDALAAKRAQELAPSNLGQERAAFEAAQRKAAEVELMAQQAAAQPSLEAAAAGVSPQQYAQFLNQQTPPVVAQPPIAPQPVSMYTDIGQQAQTVMNIMKDEARKRGQIFEPNTEMAQQLAAALMAARKK